MIGWSLLAVAGVGLLAWLCLRALLARPPEWYEDESKTRYPGENHVGDDYVAPPAAKKRDAFGFVVPPPGVYSLSVDGEGCERCGRPAGEHDAEWRCPSETRRRGPPHDFDNFERQCACGLRKAEHDQLRADDPLRRHCPAGVMDSFGGL